MKGKRMFNLKSKSETPLLDKAIDDLARELETVTGDSDEYTAIMKNFIALTELQTATKRSSKVSPDTVAIVTGNLVGIALIVGHERANVITSKALSFVKALR